MRGARSKLFEASPRFRILITWAPVLGTTLLIAALHLFADPKPIGTPPWLLPVLNAIFSTFVTLLISVLAARSYIAGGPPATLLLGTGMVLFFCSSVLTSIFIPMGQINAGVATYNIGTSLAAIANALGALQFLLRSDLRGRWSRMTALWVNYSAAIVLMGIVGFCARLDYLPVFFTQQHGPTMIRQIVLANGIGFFSLAAVLLLVLAQQHRSKFFHYYAMGLLMMAVGFSGVLGQLSLDSWLNWGGRFGQYVGGIYLLLAAREAFRQSRRWMMPLQEALRQSEQSRRLALDSAEMGTWIYTFNTRICEYDEQAQRLYGLEASIMQVDPHDIQQRIFIDDLPAVRQAVTAACDPSGDGRYHVDYRSPRGKNELRWLSVWGRVEFDEHRRPVRMVGVCRDITSQRTAEAEQQERERLLGLALSAGRAGVWAWDLKTNEVEWSEQYFQIMGLEPGSATPSAQLGMSMVHPEDLAKVEELIREAFRCGTPIDHVHRIIWPDGSMHWIRALGQTFYDAEGKAVRMAGLALDVTAQKLIEEDLKLAKESAESANRAKDQFLAALSHELRTPLAPVAMTVSSLEHEPELPDRVRQELTMIRRNIDLEVRIIDDLLDISRVTTGKMRLHPEVVRVQDLLREAAEICDADIQARHIELEFELNATFDQVNADPGRLQQVFWNLIKNAVKFTPENGKVILRCRNTDEGLVQVQVVDSGIGIPPEALPKIFGAFEQADSSISRQFGGLGLGLAISRSIIELHCGIIKASSDGVGKGSVFTVELIPASSDHAPLADRAATKLPQHAHAKARVLLVEDHLDTARTLARLLRLSGHEVETAHTVATALHALESSRFDILISDLGLPDGTGYELMAKVRQHWNIPGICTSGYGTETDMEKSREAGFFTHLTKPITYEQLDRALQQLLNKKTTGCANQS